MGLTGSGRRVTSTNELVIAAGLFPGFLAAPHPTGVRPLPPVSTGDRAHRSRHLHCHTGHHQLQRTPGPHRDTCRQRPSGVLCAPTHTPKTQQTQLPRPLAPLLTHARSEHADGMPCPKSDTAPRALGPGVLPLEAQDALSLPHLRKEGFLVGVLDVLKVGGGDLHLMWLNKARGEGRGSESQHPLGLSPRP